MVGQLLTPEKNVKSYTRTVNLKQGMFCVAWLKSVTAITETLISTITAMQLHWKNVQMGCGGKGKGAGKGTGGRG